MATNDQIRLALPAEAEYGRIARIAAAGLALRLGFTYREIEDLRLAIDETLILLLRPEDGVDGGASAGGDVTLTFDPDPERIVVDAVTTGRAPGPIDDERRERFATIVGPVVDEYAVDAEAGSVRLVKHRARA